MPGRAIWDGVIHSVRIGGGGVGSPVTAAHVTAALVEPVHMLPSGTQVATLRSLRVGGCSTTGTSRCR